MNREILHKLLATTNDYCHKHYQGHPKYREIWEEKLLDFTIQEVVDALYDNELWTEEVRNTINWHFGKKPDNK